TYLLGLARRAGILVPAMKRAALIPLALVSLLACDQSKKKEELLAKTASSSSAPLLASAAPVAAAASAPAVKPPKECGPGPEITIDDPDMEAELRLKLRKPKESSPGPLTTKELASVTSVNLTRK